MSVQAATAPAELGEQGLAKGVPNCKKVTTGIPIPTRLSPVPRSVRSASTMTSLISFVSALSSLLRDLYSTVELIGNRRLVPTAKPFTKAKAKHISLQTMEMQCNAEQCRTARFLPSEASAVSSRQGSASSNSAYSTRTVEFAHSNSFVHSHSPLHCCAAPT